MEIVLRTVFIYFFLWGLTRAMGKRELAQMSAFELLLLVTFGDLVQQAVTQEDYSLTGAVLAVGTLGLLVLTTSYVAFRWRSTRRILEGVPVIVIRNGRLLPDALHVERLAVHDLVAAAREQGIDDLRTVKLAVLEPNGRFSFLGGKDEERPEQPERMAT